MDDLIWRSVRGSTTESEEGELLAWRRAAPENESYFRAMREMLLVAESTLDLREAPPPPPIEALMTPPARPRRAPRGTLWGGLALAAAAVVLLVLGTLRPSGDVGFTLGGGEFVTGPGELVTVVLADETVVRLAPETRLRTVGVVGTREVFLDGTAYFAVRSMDEIPFRVRTHAGDATVLGTQFEIRSGEEEVRLVVLEGRVALATERTRVEVRAGEISTISRGTISEPVEVQDAREAMDWLGRFVAFQSTPLPVAAAELERVFDVPVEITDRALESETVTGWYAEQNFEQVLAIVCAVLQTECVIENGVARIGG